MEPAMGTIGTTKCGNIEFKWGERTYVIGIINVSPDSFSGDGLSDAQSALAQARRMVSEGADMLDVGGETTRPGANPITVEEELRRVIPVLKLLSPKVNVPLSIDSYKYEVASLALDAGASMINDQWCLKKDARLARLAAERGVPLILMNNLRDIDTTGIDIVSETLSSLSSGINTALKMGVPLENIIVDPGIGFLKSWKHDLAIIRRLDALKVLKRPILLGPSRKSFIKQVLDLPVKERVEGTAAAVAIGITRGADMIRVHDVKQMVRLCKMSDAILRPLFEK
jgi:dihydropteroate synthase